MINKVADGKFAFDKKGNLVQVGAASGEKGHSATFTGSLEQGIASKTTISVSIAQTAVVDGKSVDVDKKYGGGVTVGGPNAPQVVTITGHSAVDDGQHGNKIVQSPSGTLAHELATHAIPSLYASYFGNFAGNAIDDENQIRSEEGLPLRKEDPTHTEW